MPGGTLEVVVHDDWRLEQTGWAQEIAVVRLGADLLAALAALPGSTPAGSPHARP